MKRGNIVEVGNNKDNLMKLLLSTICILFVNSCSNPLDLMDCPKSPEIEKLVDLLNDTEFTIAYNYSPMLVVNGTNALKLISKGETASCYLLNNLIKGEKVKISPIILSEVHSNPDDLYFSVDYIWNNEDVESKVYTYNGLKWREDEISQESLDEIVEKWRRQLK